MRLSTYRTTLVEGWFFIFCWEHDNHFFTVWSAFVLVQENWIKLGGWKWKHFYRVLWSGVVQFDFLITQKNRRPYPLCFMRYEGREVPKSIISPFYRKQHTFSKNIINTKIFYVKFSTKMVSTKFFSTLTVTKLQSFKVNGTHLDVAVSGLFDPSRIVNAIVTSPNLVWVWWLVLRRQLYAKET